MVEQTVGTDYDQMQHFISKSPWSSFDVMDTVAEKLHALLTEQTNITGSPTPSIGLMLDESGWEKSGKESVGVARQYIGQVGKIANGQVGVFASLSDGDQVGLVQGRLYLPKEWTTDSKRCDKVGIPEDKRLYKTKPELAVEILKSLPESVTYDWVGGDCIYGNSQVVRQYLYNKKQAFVLDVGEELGIYLDLPKIYLPSKKEGRGRIPTAYVCDDKATALKDLIKKIPEEQWQLITHRQGTKGSLVRRATIQNVFVWKPERGTNIEAVQLLISTEPDGSEVKYSLCYQPNESIDLSILLFRQMQRYWIERAFQNIKEQLGLHQYQVRSWKAWHHHIALTLMALNFMLEVQKETQEEVPLISLPDIKLIFAKRLLNKLDSDEGLINAINARHKKRQDDLDRFSKVPK